MSRYAAVGGNSLDLDARRVARAVLVCATLYNPDKTFGMDCADSGALAELVDTAEEHIEHIATHFSQRSAMSPPTAQGETT
jgi:hypothetical protein